MDGALELDVYVSDGITCSIEPEDASGDWMPALLSVVRQSDSAVGLKVFVCQSFSAHQICFTSVR